MNLTPVILTIHTILVLALVGVVLLQRSEGGGALGMGGGGGGGFMTGRGVTNALTRTTTVLAALFFVTSMVLALMADRGVTEADLVRSVTGEDPVAVEDGPGVLGGDDIIDILGVGAATPPVAAPVELPDAAPAEPAESTPETPEN